MADKNLDEYKSNKFYKDNSKARQNGFTRFAKDGAHYFALYKDGDIALISQSYVNEAGRDNGIESVRKNSKLKARYNFDTRAGKKYGFALKAGNGQEVAISPNFTTKAKAEHVAGRLNGSVTSKAKKAAPAKAKAAPKKAAPKKTAPVKAKTDGRIENYHPLAFYKRHGGGVKEGFDSFSEGKAHYFTYNKNGKIALISESYTSKAGRDNGIASVKKNMPLKERYEHHTHKNGKHYFDLNAGNRQEIATSVWYSSAAASLAGAAALRGEKANKKSANDEDNYRPLAFYNKHTKGRKNGIEKFKGEDGLYYFAHFENGKIRLLSEGYPTTNARDTGVASVEKNIKIEKRYEYRGPFKNGKYDYRLKAGNGKEIARSVWYGSAAAAATGAAYLIGSRKRTKPKAKAVVKPKAKTTVKRKTVSKKAAAAGLGAAALGASAAAARPKPKAKAVPPVKPAVVKPTPPPMAKPAVPVAKAVAASAATAGVAKAGAVAAGATASATGGGFNWGFLKWLLPLLLLLLLGLFGLKSCDGNKAKLQAEAAAAAKVAADEAAMAKKATAEKAAKLKAEAEAKAKAAAATAAAAAASAAEVAAQARVQEPAPVSEPEIVTQTSYTSRACGPSSIGIFDIPNTAPVSLSYLGSNPEFGDSHGLTPRQFYDKLNARYSASTYDANYLDYVFRQIGYEGGFKDVEASAFSNETLPQGVKGLLGFGQQHAYQYSKLNVTNPRDLESFRIQSKNGRDINFMKTCGNYMYACE